MEYLHLHHHKWTFFCYFRVEKYVKSLNKADVMEDNSPRDQPEMTKDDYENTLVIQTLVEISNISSEDTAIDFEKCKDFVILDDTDFEKNKSNTKTENSELTSFTSSASFSTSTPVKSGGGNPKVGDTDDKSEGKNQSKVEFEENSKLVKIPAKKEPVNDKNTENDSLIITADEMELDNEMETKEKETTNGAPPKKENETTNKKNTNKQEAEVKTTAPKPPKDKMETVKTPTKFVLWVMNVNRTIKASDLKRHFCKFGKVSAAKIVTDGKRCFGHITLQKLQDVESCIKYLNNTYYEGKKITVSTSPPEKTFENEYSELKIPGTNDGDRKIKETKKRVVVEDPLTTKFSGSDGKPPKSSCNHEKLHKENERLRRHLREEELRINEERNKMKMKEEALREMDFKLKQERHKLKMERELFEKERQEVFRLDQERRKLEEEKLEILRYKSKVEEELRVKKRKLTKDFVRSRSEEKQKTVKSKIGESHLSKPSSSGYVKSRVRSRSRSRGKIEENYYRRERDDHSKHFMRPPPPPKLSDRFSTDKKYYGEKRSPDRKYDDYHRYPIKKSLPERRPKSHRDGKTPSERFGVAPYEVSSCDQWKQNLPQTTLQKITDGWPQVNSMEQWKASPNQPETTSSSNGGRYQDPSFPFQFGTSGGSSRSWYPAPPGTDFSRYEHYNQPPLSSRKY